MRKLTSGNVNSDAHVKFALGLFNIRNDCSFIYCIRIIEQQMFIKNKVRSETV